MKKRRKFAEKLKVAMLLLSVIASTLFYAPMSVKASVSSDTSSGSFSGQTQTSNMQLFQPPQSIALESATNYLKSLASGFYKIDYSGDIAFTCDSNSRMASLGLILRYGSNRISLFNGYVGSGTSDSGWTKNYNVPFSGSFIIEVNSSTNLDYFYSGNLLFEGVGKFKLDHTLKLNFDSVTKMSDDFKPPIDSDTVESVLNRDYTFPSAPVNIDIDKSTVTTANSRSIVLDFAIPINLAQLMANDYTAKLICSGSSMFLSIPEGVHFDLQFGGLSDSVHGTAEVLSAFLCFGNDVVALKPYNSGSGLAPVVAQFDVSGYEGKEIVSPFYVKMSVLVSVRDLSAGNNKLPSASLTARVLFKKGTHLYLSFSSRNSGATSGDIEDLENSVTGSIDSQTQQQQQNHDELLNGFDTSGGNASHNKFQGSVNDYEAAEDSLFATATENIGKFEFFDFQSIAAVMTGITFVTSTMTKIFNLSGGIDGMGIILSVLFSVMLVSMALGLYQRYQSNGHYNKGGKGGRSGTGRSGGDKGKKGGGN